MFDLFLIILIRVNMIWIILDEIREIQIAALTIGIEQEGTTNFAGKNF